MANSWAHFKSRASRSLDFSWLEDAIVAGITALIGYLVLDRKSATENAVGAILIGLSAVLIWQGCKFAWRFIWSVPREIEQERDEARAKLAVKNGLPPYHPKIILDRYGKTGNTSGVFIFNDGYPAYEISIPDAVFGVSQHRLTFNKKLPRLIDKQGEQFFEAWLEHVDGTGQDGGELHTYMVLTDTHSLCIGVIYNDGEYNSSREFNWYRSNFAIERDATAGNGLMVKFLSQELIPKPMRS